MTKFVESADGTRIAYDVEGSGPAIVLVGGASQFRAFDPGTVALAHRLAANGLTVVNYDRRGRGESTDTPPYSVDREIEDIAALIDATAIAERASTAVGGGAVLYGSSSGGALCLHAAAAGLPVTGLALWEIPLTLEGQGDGGAGLAGLQERLAAGDRPATVEYFMRDMPPEWLQGLRDSPAWPAMLSIAPTLAYDAANLHLAEQRPWVEQWGAVSVPVLIMVGERTLPIFPPAAKALAAILPRAEQITLPGADHRWDEDAMVSRLAEFVLRTAAPGAARTS
jgi:pimeloyl-ACP methyl ester carboxylesterase